MAKCDASCGKIEFRTFLDKNRNMVQIIYLQDGTDIYPFFTTFISLLPELELYVQDNNDDIFCFGHEK